MPAPSEDYDILLSIQKQLGALDANVLTLRDEMKSVCNFKDEVSKIAQDFITYRESRRFLPDRVNVVEQRIAATENAIREHCATTAWIAEKVAKSDNYFKAAMLAWGGLVSIVGLLIMLHKYLGIVFTLK
jgi:DNA repair ATPase RecN